MTRESHIAALERRHQELETKLQAELNHPATNEQTILEIKRRKLEIKDELARHNTSAA